VSSSQPTPEIARDTVKVCGIRTPEDAVVAVQAGATLIGMIFAPTRRQVDHRTARLISDAVHATGTGARTVGVFVNPSAENVNEAIRAAHLDLVQLNGDEDALFVSKLDRPAIRAFRIPPGQSAADLKNRIVAHRSIDHPPMAFMVDGYDPHAHGGTGVRADWDLVSRASRESGHPLGIAGGLTPENVGEAITTVRPLFVDVSSGVERDGIKDPNLIRAFVEAGLTGFRELREPEGAVSPARR
jgi:phosphoribosylanthranilate isomerase